MPHDDFAIEPVPGLPETPPDGEHILWQGRPDGWALAKRSMSLGWIVAYFLALAIWRFGSVVDQVGWAQAAALSAPFLILALIVCGLLTLFAVVQARTSVYTVTNKRVAMRIGAALTVTLNLPFTQIASAALDLQRDGTGTIAFALKGRTRLSYLMCWPHVRPWRLRHPEPALRCIPNAREVADLLADAIDARVSIPTVAARHTAGALAAE